MSDALKKFFSFVDDIWIKEFFKLLIEKFSELRYIWLLVLANLPLRAILSLFNMI